MPDIITIPDDLELLMAMSKSGASRATTPSIQAGAAADSVTISGFEDRGVITASDSTALTVGDICTVTFSMPHQTAPAVLCQARTSGANIVLTVPTTATTFVVNCAAVTGTIKSLEILYVVYGIARR